MNSSTPKHSVSVAAAIVDEAGRVLATRRRDNGQWEPPGGVLELDESIEDGLVREVLEETGLLVRPLQLTGVYKNMVRGIVALVFRCEIVKRHVAVTTEVDEICWLAPAEIAERMDEAYAVRVLDALDDRRPSVRAHDGRVLLRS
ncbi:MAG TPA: NUDIX hydrolase [Herpetosiphonaceae bacterium]|nr:NUDIX hydrolase [Herpetosiphonaceae bacterium]